jgi:hypothetical protein
MKISKEHQRLANHLGTEEVLTNPEPFLGPNWETVLRFWLYFESLTFKQMDELDRRYYRLNSSYSSRAWKLAAETSEEIIGNVIDRFSFSTSYLLDATYELIAMHLLFERGHSLTFVPLIKDL